jgi:hypothetical protein
MSNPESTSPRLILSVPSSLPGDELDQILADFNLPEPLIKVRKTEPEMYAAFEWTLPTVFFVYIGKLFVDELLKQTAKDTAPKLIEGVKAMARRCREMNIRWFTATSSTEKLSRRYKQSAGFSILIQTPGGQIVKMLFDEELSAKDWEDAIDGLLTVITTKGESVPQNEDTKAAVTQLVKPNSQLYVIYNRESKDWEMHNDKTMFELQHKPLS